MAVRKDRPHAGSGTERVARLMEIAEQQAMQGQLYHVGVVTRDLDVAMQHYRTLLGVPSFHRLDTNYPARFRDWTGTVANRNAFGKWGAVIVEIVEPGRGNGPAGYYLERYGEGVFHVGYVTDDPTQRPGGADVCFEVRSTARADGTYGIVYLDTIDTLGFFIELVDTPIANRFIEIVDQLPRG